ncbi:MULTISPECIES: hypothetical protein [Pseudomonas]|uniref:hypothetical protein n=1 Tax=Pseudomonas TaxID=286 RepID=UPI0010130A52|nr:MULTISPECIES: hypothetical protein [Pseudomonas]
MLNKDCGRPHAFDALYLVFVIDEGSNGGLCVVLGTDEEQLSALASYLVLACPPCARLWWRSTASRNDLDEHHGKRPIEALKGF